jgi:hypothetical protein
VAKSQVAPMSECAFLGFTIKGKKIRWTYKALADFKHRIKELTGRSWGVSMEYRLRKLGQYQPRAASLVTAAHRHTTSTALAAPIAPPAPGYVARNVGLRGVAVANGQRLQQAVAAFGVACSGIWPGRFRSW